MKTSTYNGMLPRNTNRSRKGPNASSQFARAIPSGQYAAYLANPPKRKYDDQGRRRK